jgi:uncharacterized membrane protein
MRISGVTPLDLIALTWFLACWLGYGRYATWLARKRPSLVAAVRVFRQRWTERMCDRDNHQSDATILGNLLRGALFFASTTMFILGGLVALLGTTPRIIEVVSQLPFTGPFEVWFWELKALLLIGIYIYAFFKFTWSALQYNVLSIVLGASPAPGAASEERMHHIETATQIAAMAGESYNNGIRAYYFSIAPMAWFIHPLLLIAATSVVTIAIYRREFHSPMLSALMSGAPPKKRL